MHFPPLGRLYWKFLVFFFVAQTTTVLGIGLAIWATVPEYEPEYGESRPPFAAPAEPGAARGFPPPMAGMGGDGSPPRLPPPSAKVPFVHLLAGAIVSLIFAALLAAYVSRPIRRLRQALQAAADGRLDGGLAAAMGNRRDELADLGRDFDRMARHLAQLMEGQRRLLHDVSHELRSPLARLSAIIGLARQQPDCLEDCLARLEHESARMDRLLSELLTLSRLESGMVERSSELVDLADLLEDVVADAAPEVEQAACRVDMSRGPAALVRGDPEMLHRVFDNLLRNALLHAASGRWVGITLVVDGDEASVRVEDRGPGVLSADIDRLFLPFYRSRQTAGRNGHGLGLAITRQIVENHQGRIDVANRREGGLCVTVHLPLADAGTAAIASD
jgi:signal transduction histidine kinase